MNARRGLPSAPLVISVLALILACAGTAAAINANSVRSKHIVNGRVMSADLARGAVKSAKLADGAVVGVNHLAPHSVTSAKVAPNSIRFWRAQRRLTQMDLALDANLSTKHLSFVETGLAPEPPAPHPPRPAPRPADRRA